MDIRILKIYMLVGTLCCFQYNKTFLLEAKQACSVLVIPGVLCHVIAIKDC